MSLTKVYFKAPVWLQNVACASISVLNYRERYGGDFPDVMAEYRERREWSADRLADYRDHRLRKMVDHCYRTVPYYTRLFNDLGVAPSEIKTIDDLRLLPVLSKDDVRVVCTPSGQVRICPVRYRRCWRAHWACSATGWVSCCSSWWWSTT